MKRSILLVVFLFMAFRPGIIAQDFLDTVSHIPVVVTSWQNIDDRYKPGIPLIKAMGADAMVIANQNWDSLFLFDSLKILHYRHQEQATPYDIVKYTDASYVVYEAEGTKLQDGRASLKLGVVGSIESDSGYAQVSGTTAGYFIEGPGVLMRKEYQDFQSGELIGYRSDYILKLSKEDTAQIDEGAYICEIQITMRLNTDFDDMKVCFKKKITYGEFVSNGLNQWHEFPLNYNLANYPIEVAKHRLPSVWENEGESYYVSSFVEYRVFWYGLAGCTLYVDKIITSDLRGREIKFDSTARTKVFTAATNYIDSDHMLGWYGMEEPKFIDNYEPYRVVDSLIRAATNNTQFLHTSITVGELGQYWYWSHGSWPLSPLIEFAKRAKPHSIHLNSYHYDYPNPTGSQDYHQRNINYVLKNLDSMAILYRDYELDYSYAVFGGDGYYYDKNGIQSHVLKRPSEEQLLYTTNLGLLYGARQIWIDPAFSYYYNNNPGTPGAYGLLDIDLCTTSTYNTFKDIIIPRLHGIFGKTLRKLSAVSQFKEVIPGLQPVNLGSDFRIIKNNSPEVSNVFELGVFDNPVSTVAKYLFVLYRFTEPELSPNSISIVVKNLNSGYNNYRVHELATNTSGVHSRAGDNSITYNISITPGDGRLYEILPVQLASGDKSYLYNETFTVNDTVYANDTLIVGPGVALTFNNGSSLINHGTMIIQGTEQQPVSLNFVHPTGSNGLHNYGRLEMNHTTVANASFGISNSNGSLIVNSSVIHNNTTGISSTRTGASEIQDLSILNSEFYLNNTGIMTSQTLGSIRDCKLYNNYYGVVLTNNTVVTFGDNAIQGNNCIYVNAIGVLVNGSMPVIGSNGQSWVGGNNSISANDVWDCMIINYSSVLAENNFWDTRAIMVDRTSSASFQPEIFVDPCGQNGSSLLVRGDEGKQKSMQNGLEGGEDDIIKQAYSLIQGARFREGIQLCKQVIDNSPDTSIAAPALMLLSLAEQKHQLNELKPYLQLLSASTTENRVRFVADMLLANDSNGNTRSRIELLLEKYVDTDIREEIHFSIFREYLFAERDTTGARGILRMMKERYNGQLTILAGIMMDGKKTPGGVSKPMNTEDGTTIPVEYQLKGNYPNPFNPETVIEYGIPEAAEVTLEVYDIMGRLMNRETKNLQAGYHFYTWNGKEAASGVYLYRIMMKSQKDRKVRTFSSKMMLLR